MKLEDELSIIREAKENIQAFSTLYQFYYPKVFKYIYYRVLNDNVAEDIASTAFIKAIEHIKTFDESKSHTLRPWIFTIAHNETLKYFNKNGGKVARDHTIEQIDESKDHSVITEEKLSIAQTIKRMKPEYQQVLSLKYFGGLSHAEIGQITNKTEENTRVLLHRALKQFQKLFKKV